MTSHTAKVVIITGASSGLGEALAFEYASTGWKVGLIARRKERLESIVESIAERIGGDATNAVKFQVADVADRSAIVSAIDALRESLGTVDLLIANAGVGRPDYVDPFTIDDMEMMFQVNTLGVLYSISAVLPDMIERKGGHIAAVSSSGSYKGMPGSAAYCASKSAVNTLMEGLRIQLREHKVDFTTICPGFIKTPMTDTNEFKMPWLQEPAQAATKVAKAIRRKRKVYNFPWQLAFIVKLFRYLPDWAVAKFVPRKTDTAPDAFQ